MSSEASSAAEDPDLDPVDKLKQWRQISAVLAVLLVGSVITLMFLIRSAENDEPTSGGSSAQVLRAAEKAADAAARQAAVSLTTYDYASLEEDFSWAETAGTAKFQDQYAEVSAPIRELVTETRAHAEGTVVDSAARAVDADHVTVLLFVDQTLTSKGSDRPTLDQPRLTMMMVREDGRWLLDEVKLSNLTSN
ncbi:hypothetical protein EFK50_02180 [Nocardioides marmoriginsengisoli]|uniref:Mce-associated membrane protein n=1 Tax=Nocardioides marmoriginsengisoli TaxID=661483 RepID=A0A3N0CN99_9ACTN|nr:hypothetical protein [Nocardioides marmoriginsengisoli]RNL64820.1 hypothetical protein EFK50_02180 [Nocardioides marmoriginsengisoli]